MLIKCYLSNYNGVIKATLVSGVRSTQQLFYGPAGDVIQSGSSRRSVLSTELQPPRSLSASHSCLNMSQDGGQCRIDVSILEALWLTTTTGQFNLRLNRLAPVFRGRLVTLRGPLFVVLFQRQPRSLFRKRIPDLFLTLMKVALSLIRNWSSLFNSTSIGHCKRASRGDAAGGCAEIKAERRGFWWWGKRRSSSRLAIFIACCSTFTGASSSRS